MSKVMAIYLVVTVLSMCTQLLWHFLYVPLACKYVPLPEAGWKWTPMCDAHGVTLWDPSFWGFALPQLGGMGITADFELRWHLHVRPRKQQADKLWLLLWVFYCCWSGTPETSFLSPDDFIVLKLLATTSDFFNVFSYRSASCVFL